VSPLGKGSILILLQTKFRRLLDKHLYLLLLIPLIFIVYPLSAPGISLTGDFPYLDTPDYASNRLWTWLERGSFDGFEFLSRLPIIGSWYLLGFVGVNSELATKSMVVLGFVLSSFSFYISFLLFFKDKFNGSNIALKLSSLMGSYFYAYNEWSFNRIHHWYLWIGYSILPLFFISIYFSFKNPKDWKYIISSIFLWSIASTTPHMTLFCGIILGVTFLGFIFNNLKNKKNGIVGLVFVFVVIFVCYVLVNMYWIYPYILASTMHAIAPNYEVTQDILQILSREGNFVNTLRILAYWLSSGVITPDDSYYFIWIYASIVIPIVAFSSLLLRKSIKYAVIFSGMALIATLLAMGTKSPIDYYKLILTSAPLTSFTWLLRDADKWSALIVFAYSFLIGIVSYKFFSVTKEKNYNKRKLLIPGSFMFLILGSILVVSYPFYTARMDPLIPLILPAEFDKLNVYLSTIGEDKIYFMPYPLYETQWHKSGRVSTIYQSHSIKPSIESTEYNFLARNYYNYLASSIKENKTKSIGNMINPLGTSYVIFHNDTWSKTQNTYDKSNIDLLNKLYLLEDLKNVSNVGFYKVFKTSNDTDANPIGEINIPMQSIGVFSGLDTFASLSTIPSFNTLRSSLIFLDDSLIKSAANLRGLDGFILSGSSSADDLVFSITDEKYLITPFDTTFRNDPLLVWSRSRATDPIHAEYHPPLENLGITNWDFDYGKGLVMTKAMDANLSIPIEIMDQDNNGKNQDNDYYLFVRYLKNQKGGQINIHLDNKLIQTIDTLDRNSNKFAWQKVDSVNLANGNHTLNLENVVGFNAVNLFALIPHDEMDRLRTVANGILTDHKRIIYLMEAESNFYNSKGIKKDSLLLFGNNSSVTNVTSNNRITGEDIRTFEGQFKVPENSDLVALEFFAKGNASVEDPLSINTLEISPSNRKYKLFNSDLERRIENIPLGSLRKLNWINYDKDLQTISLETNNTLQGNYSLKVSTKQGDRAGFNVLSTDFIPLKEGSYYGANLDVSAKDVKQLHSRILYYDFRGEITGATDYIFEGKDGTFRDTFTSSIVPPKQAAYLKLQVLTLSSNAKTSSYILDNVGIDEVTYPTNYEKNSYFEHGPNGHNISDSKRAVYSNIDVKSNASNSIMRTNPIPVHQNFTYNYKITAETKNMTSYYATASFRDSGDVSQNNTKYGYNASDGSVLSLSNGSEIQSELEIIKPANYSIALRAMTCETCTFLNLSIQNTEDLKENKYDKNLQSDSISLQDKNSGLKWLNSNSTYYLNKGRYTLKIYSDSNADLDSVIIYQNNNNIASEVTKNSNQTLNNLFNVNSPAANLTEIKKINPTKYVVNIENATKPYTISLAEAYDPLWVAYEAKSSENHNSNNFKTNSIPMYGVTNGFYVNKTGDYELVIEYEPQNWLVQGATISISILILLSVITIFLYKKKYFIAGYRKIRKNSQTE